MHAIFALEDMYCLRISEVDSEPCLHLTQHWVHLLSQELSDMQVEEFQKGSKKKK
ncbi:hypothetical protein MKC93_12565 [[Clostridium] innocuum]|nr:hypothetical protein [[Clostridium] innocuum]